MNADDRRCEMDAKNQPEKSQTGGTLGGVIGGLIIIGICGGLCYLAYTAIFHDYSIYYKDEAFLSNAKTVYAQVAERYVSNSNENVYEFYCGKRCTEQYSEKKGLRMKYEIDGKEYESDMFVVNSHNEQYYKMDHIQLPEKGDWVDIYYNVEDPKDIRLQYDIMIQRLNYGSWYERHGHWIWIVLWGLLGIVSLGGALFMSTGTVLLVLSSITGKK